MSIIQANRFGKGQHLIILHGFLGMGDNWKSLGKKWAANGYCVHLLDMRNHGKSFHDDTFNYEVMTQDVVDYLAYEQIKNVQVIGHSMGGKIAMHLAVNHPQLVDKLVVVDIGPKSYPSHHDEILEGLTLLEENQLESRKKADELLSKTIKEPGIRQFLLKNLYRDKGNLLRLRVNLRVIKENVDEIGKELPYELQFTGPALFVRGDQSDYITAADEKRILHHFPNAGIKSIQNSGHWVHAEQPVVFFDTVDSYLN
mgnify:CR=1 FL=1